jgi:fatty-acyl-CoA synthase
VNTGFLTAGQLQLPRRNRADRPAISMEDGTSWTYRQLHDQVNRYAVTLVELGVKKGDRVGILLYNSLEYWAAYLAATRLGAIAVRLNWRLSGEELGYALNDSGCSVLCLHDTFVPAIEPIRAQVPVQSFVCFAYDGTGSPEWAIDQDKFDSADPAELTVEEPALDDPAMLMYTSGTTGRPKGALWTHGNTLWLGAMQIMQWQYTEDTVTMTSGPLYHVSSFEDLAVPTLMMGGHTVLTKSGGFSIERVLQVLANRAVTDTLLQPMMIYELLRVPKLESYDLSKLRRIATGGSAIMPWAVREIQQKLPSVELVPGYGLTEGGAIATVSALRYLESNPDSVGKPMPMTEVRIVRDDGTAAAVDEDGEVWVRSPAVSQGYWGKAAETAETFVDGWCKTGDAGHVDQEGLLTLTGRKKDMIKTGGENVYPAEIEAVLSDHPNILEAAVIAVPDARFQEAVCAVVVIDGAEPLSAEDVRSYCQQRLAGYKKPRYVVFADELPRNLAGKILKFELRQQYAVLGTEEGRPVSDSEGS